MAHADRVTVAPSAANRWGAALDAWSIPSWIVAQAPESPWVHPPRMFAVDPTDPSDSPAESPSHRAARLALDGGGTVLDVGCGGGRSSLALVPAADSFTGVDQQAEMLANFAAAFDAAGIRHREVLGRWPDVADEIDGADVVVCHHVVYNVGEIDPFITALTTHAARRVVVELSEHHPMSPFTPLWRHFWSIDRPAEPSADLFVEVVESQGLRPVVQRLTRPPRKPTLDDAVYIEFVRRRLCLPARRDPEIVAQLAMLPARQPDFTVTVSWDGSGRPG
jgi:SAM-dependent methyltransferase